jgi:hypothetical protein
MFKSAGALLVACLACIGLLSRPPAAPLRHGEGLLLPRASFLSAVLPGYQHLVADYFWILTINQIGSARTPREHRDIYTYADLVTDLDPLFARVYSFAGVTIPVRVGREEYANAEESTRLLRKGAKHVPWDSRTRFQLAYNLSYFHHEYVEAAKLYEQLAEEPDAPPYLRPLATRLLAQAGDFDMSRVLTRQMLESAEDEEMREYYERRLREIDQEQILQKIDQIAQTFRAQQGRFPTGLDELLARGFIRAIPADPLGGTFYIDGEGRGRSTAAEHRLQLIVDDAAGEP